MSVISAIKFLCLCLPPRTLQEKLPLALPSQVSGANGWLFPFGIERGFGRPQSPSFPPPFHLFISLTLSFPLSLKEKLRDFRCVIFLSPILNMEVVLDLISYAL